MVLKMASKFDAYVTNYRHSICQGVLPVALKDIQLLTLSLTKRPGDETLQAVVIMTRATSDPDDLPAGRGTAQVALARAYTVQSRALPAGHQADELLAGSWRSSAPGGAWRARARHVRQPGDRLHHRTGRV